MCRISILAPERDAGRQLSGWLGAWCAEHGILPRLDVPEDLRGYFYMVGADPPDVVMVALPGVAGLNTVEHLRQLCPHCSVIWCSDLDFSLQAYRLRVDYFILGPPGREELATGLAVCLDRRRRLTGTQNEVVTA